MNICTQYQFSAHAQNFCKRETLKPFWMPFLEVARPFAPDEERLRFSEICHVKLVLLEILKIFILYTPYIKIPIQYTQFSGNH